MDEIHARAAAGARWLDEQMPGWEFLIDLDRLLMESFCRCVLGQLVGNYEELADCTDDPVRVQSGHLSRTEATSLGFHVRAEDFDGFRRLTDSWKTLIATRRNDPVHV